MSEDDIPSWLLGDGDRDELDLAGPKALKQSPFDEDVAAGISSECVLVWEGGNGNDYDHGQLMSVAEYHEVRCAVSCIFAAAVLSPAEYTKSKHVCTPKHPLVTRFLSLFGAPVFFSAIPQNTSSWNRSWIATRRKRRRAKPTPSASSATSRRWPPFPRKTRVHFGSGKRKKPSCSRSTREISKPTTRSSRYGRQLKEVVEKVLSPSRFFTLAECAWLEPS